MPEAASAVQGEIKYLRVRNYKSLKDVELRPGPFTVLVGPNASGKSNFIDCLDFLSRCVRDGLAAAVATRGGYENVAFRRAERTRDDVVFCVHLDITSRGTSASVEHEFRFRAQNGGIGAAYEVTSESVQVEYRSQSGLEKYKLDRQGTTIKMGTPDQRPTVVHVDFGKDELLLGLAFGREPFGFRFWSELRAYLSRLAVFQISPANTRKAGDPSGRRELERRGGNLPPAVEFLKTVHPDRFAVLLGHLRNAEPSFTSIDTDYLAANDLGLFLREEGVSRPWYVTALSDGTLQTIALFLPVLDPRYSVVAIEEPENSLHPWVLQDFVDACREQAEQKQVIVTTHSPVLVSHLRPEELHLVDRKAGATHIVRATDVDRDLGEIVREGIMDLGRYWTSGRMSAVPGGESLEELIEDREGGDDEHGTSDGSSC